MFKPRKLISFTLITVLSLYFATITWAEEDHNIFLPLIMISGESALPSELRITGITDNRSEYTDGQIPTFEKFEITFQVENTVAGNMQFPYDPSPPPGIDPLNSNYQGITVNAVFSPDNWQTTYTQPAFYYQEFQNQSLGNKNWYYPTENFAWKVRFAPDQPGSWQYKLTAQDASGKAESSIGHFTVISSQNPGFIKVSENDARYFEFENGDYFPGLGYNLNYDQVDWIHPVISNMENFKKMSENDIRLVRIWLSQWSIYGSAWNPWYSPDPAKHSQYIPIPGITIGDSYMGNEVSLLLRWGSNWYSPCMFIGNWKAKPAVLQNTAYRVQVRYKVGLLEGPRDPAHSYGLVAKTGNWLWGSEYCYDAGTGQKIAASYPGTAWQNYPDPEEASWQIMEGIWESGNEDFLPYFYLVLENITDGGVYIDQVSIQEIQGGGQYGPNIVSKPLMSHHLYFEQRNSYAFDQLLELAESYDIYLRPVILEKNEWISNHIGEDGSFTSESVNNFYGQWRQETKGRWLQQAWWRYLQARWGYSTQIHSWELLNEGDPTNTRHYALADELGKFMGCEVFEMPVGNQNGDICSFDHPNAHLVSTSFWHSFPVENFWGSANYPNIDFADVHAYISTGWINDPEHQNDASSYHIDYGRNVRQRLNADSGAGSTKPIIRGEAGIDFLNEQIEQPGLENDNAGVWLHNFLWASLDANAMIEEYWWTENINEQPGPDGIAGLHDVFSYFADFIENIPLNNGYYQDAEAIVSNPEMLVVGQKDTVHDRAHLWVKNARHTWQHVVDSEPGISGLFGTVMVEGLSPNTTLTVEFHSFTSTGLPLISYASATTDSNGRLVISLPNDPEFTDVGIKVEP